MMQTGNVGEKQVGGREGVFSGMMSDGGEKELKVIKMQLSRDILLGEGAFRRDRKWGQQHWGTIGRKGPFEEDRDERLPLKQLPNTTRTLSQLNPTSM